VRFETDMVFFEVLKQGNTTAHDREKYRNMIAQSNFTIADRTQPLQPPV